MLEEMKQAIIEYVENNKFNSCDGTIVESFAIMESDGNKLPKLLIPKRVLGKDSMYEGLLDMIKSHNITTIAIVSEAFISIKEQGINEEIKWGINTKKNMKKEVLSATIISEDNAEVLWWDIARIEGFLPLLGKLQSGHGNTINGRMKDLQDAIKSNSNRTQLDW